MTNRIYYAITDAIWINKNILKLVLDDYSDYDIHVVLPLMEGKFGRDDIEQIDITTYSDFPSLIIAKGPRDILIILKDDTEYKSNNFHLVKKK